MAVKNFREDRDIKSGRGAASPGAVRFALGEVRTMAKDLAMARDHLAAQHDAKLIGKRDEKPTAPPERLAKSGQKDQQPRPTPAAGIKSTAVRPAGGHLPFVRVFFEALFVVLFFGLLALAAGYYWLVIRDTERLISEPLPPVYIGRIDLPTEPRPPLASAPLLLTDDQTQLALVDLTDEAAFLSQLAQAQNSPINEGSFKRLVLTDADGQELAAAVLADLLRPPLPTAAAVEAYTLFIFGQKPANTWGLVIKVAPVSAPEFFAEVATEDWQARLIQFAEQFGLTISSDQPAQFQTTAYRGQTIIYLNFSELVALDVIPFFESRLLGVATSKEAAFRLIDRVLVGL